MHFVEGGTYTSGFTNYNIITERDTSLLFHTALQRKEVDAFYISATEVTNAEYWVFYSAMVDELGYERAMESYYPDTLVWVTDFAYTYNEPMTRNYHLHPYYDNYPVVGISWVQAQAYCEWKTKQFQSLVGRGERIDLIFRLPTQYEWEYAALGSIEFGEPIAYYPWEGYEYKKNDEYLANFGKVVDVNGVTIKNYHEDGGLYPSTVGMYTPNRNGLYDMAGNVAEWVSDTAKFLNGASQKMIFKESDMDSLIDRIALESQNIKYLEGLKHNKKILLKGDMRVIKGGAWSDGLAYLQVGSIEAMDKDKQSSRVGFRIAVSYNKKYEKYFPKKYWQPSKK